MSAVKAKIINYGDHRIRVAKEKRERMRTHLLDAVLAVYPGDSSGPAVIDDVIKFAGVSRGSFYKYFPSLEEAVDELGTRLAEEMAVAFAALYEELDDPTMRTATGFQLFLSRAKIEPRWGVFVSHANHLASDNQLLFYIKMDLKNGVKLGAYKFSSIDVAADLILGAMIEGMRRIMKGASSRLYIETLTGMLFRSLEVPAKKADKIVKAASLRLHHEAPARLAWWVPFD